MLRYSFGRLLGALPTLLVLIAFSFFMIHSVPGGPFSTDRNLLPEVEANLTAAYHLDEPVYRQFGRYVFDLAHFDFGPSFQYRDYSVTELILTGLPVSLKLGAAAMVVALALGVSAGCFAALRQNRAADHAVMTVAMTGISIPNFVMAPLLVLVFAVYLRWLPAGGLRDLGGMVLPVISLALPQIAYLARLTRGSMIEVLHSHFVRTARAQGLSMRQIVLKHALKPALLPVVSYLGPATAAVITGSVVIEQIFSVPGIGRFFVNGALNRDYTLVMGVVVFYGALIIAFNFFVDVAYAWLDPEGLVPVSANAGAVGANVTGRSLWGDAWRTLKRNRAAVIAGWTLGALIALVIVGPWFAGYAFDFTDFANASSAPSLANGHWFGTDTLGRDIFARTLYGGRISLLIGVVSTAVSLLVGVAYGAIAGYFGGRTDQWLMRFVDILYALPFMFFVILLMVFFGRHIVLIFVAIGAINWLDMARIVRGQTLSLKHREFVEAAEAQGVPALTIIRRHVVPNLLGVVAVYVTLTIPQVILVESFLSFLGLGVQEPMTSWGALVHDGSLQLETAPWMLIFPAAFLALTLFCFNFIGDGMRDALDPKDR